MSELGFGSFTLVLPDVTMVGDTVYAGDYFTTEVSVGQYIAEGVPYTKGNGAVYTRGGGIRIAAMEKGGDGQHEDDQKTATVRQLAQTTATGRFRSGDGYGIDRWSSRAGILSIPPFDHILTVCANIQTDYAAAVQAVGTELLGSIRAGTFGFLLIPVGIFI